MLSTTYWMYWPLTASANPIIDVYVSGDRLQGSTCCQGFEVPEIVATFFHGYRSSCSIIADPEAVSVDEMTGLSLTDDGQRCFTDTGISELV